MAKNGEVPQKKRTDGNYPSKGGMKETKLSGITTTNMHFKPGQNPVDRGSK